MEVLDQYDHYFAIALVILSGIMGNLKLYYIVKTKSGKSFKWIELYWDNELYYNVGVRDNLRAYNPFFLGKGWYFKVNLVLTIICTLLLLQILI